MKPLTNKLARQLSSSPLVHRDATLNAISSKAHRLASEIERIGDQGRRVRDLISQAPNNAPSRLDWVHQQLTQI